MFLDIRQRELIKNSITDYKFMKEELEQRIAKGDNLEDLCKFIPKFLDTEIINLEEGATYGYLDFYYKDMTMCVSWEEDKGFKVSSAYELYDKQNMEYIIEDFLTVEEYEKLIDTPKEDMLRDAVVNLKYYDSKNMKNDYQKWLDKIIVFLKEEY